MNMKKYIWIWLLVICFVLSGCMESPATEETGLMQKEEIGRYGESAEGTGTLEVHFMDVGQGDAVFVRQGDETMLIDAGNNDKGTAVWSYLLHQNVEHLTYAVGTHPDADHIGGLDVVLYKVECDTVFLPNCENDTKTYEELIQTIGQREQKVVVPKQGEVYSLGDARIQIVSRDDEDYGDNINDYSIAFRIVYGNTSFLFTGDAEEKAEQDMLSDGLTLQSDVYKAAHHGADTANTASFLTAVNPKYCVISCGEGNSYGHPRAGVLNSLREMGVNVFRTDEQGTIVAVSDGTDITWNVSPTDSWKAGEPMGNYEKGLSSEEDTVSFESSETTYIINSRTKKFHYADCSGVKSMSDENKVVSHASREELITEGYEPCKNCEP